MVEEVRQEGGIRGGSGNEARDVCQTSFQNVSERFIIKTNNKTQNTTSKSLSHIMSSFCGGAQVLQWLTVPYLLLKYHEYP